VRPVEGLAPLFERMGSNKRQPSGGGAWFRHVLREGSAVRRKNSIQRVILRVHTRKTGVAHPRYVRPVLEGLQPFAPASSDGIVAPYRPVPRRISHPRPTVACAPASAAFSIANATASERFFNKIKPCPRIAARYEKHASNFLAMLKLAAVRIVEKERGPS